jgi:hypothetical protein
MIKPYLPFLAILSLGIAAAFAQSYPVPHIRGQLDPRSTPFNAACDGVTDDHVALAAWAAAFTAGQAGLVVGACMTSTPITFPPVSGITIEGKGGVNSRLVYIGATATGDIFKFGGATATVALNLQNIEFETNTLMPSGALLHIQNVGSTRLEGVTAGANTNAAYTSLWLDNSPSTVVDGLYFFNGSANDVLVSGQIGGGAADVWFSGGGQLANGSGIGLHIAGGVNSVNFSHGDIVGNAQSLVIDESVVAATNGSLFFGPMTFFDVASSSTNPNVELAASATGVAAARLELKGVWVASATGGQACIGIDSGYGGMVTIWGGSVENCSHDGIQINSTTATVLIDGGTYFQGTAGIDINNAANNTNVAVGNVDFVSANVHFAGPIEPVGHIGRTDGAYPPQGYVGYGLSVQNAAGTSEPSSGTPIVVNTLNLPPGFWTCNAAAETLPAGTTTTSIFSGAITAGTTIPALVDTGTFQLAGLSASGGQVLEQVWGPAQINFAPTVVNPGSFVATHVYQIATLGASPNFTAVGASSNTPGLLFTATGVGSGTGTAYATDAINEVVQSSFATSTMKLGGTLRCAVTQ